MPDIPQELTTPPLHPIWSLAKKTATAKAKELKEDKKYAELEKKMNKNLGPDLDSWPKDYPKSDKLKANKSKIDATIHTYTEAVKSAALNAAVKKPLNDALAKIQKEMDERAKEAEMWILSDKAMEESKTMSKKNLVPLKIFAQDVAKLVNAKAPKANLQAQKLWLDIVISDVKVLEKVPAAYDNAKLANSIREQADFTLVIDQLAKLLTECGANVTTDKDVPAAEKKFKEGMEKIIDAATIRGAKPIAELCKIRVDNVKYVVVQTATLIGHIGAVITGAVALAGTPFTAGASTIMGIITIVNQSIAIGEQVAKLAMDEEQLMNVVASDLKTMYDNYKGAEKLIGPAEMAKTLVTATIGIPVPSIDGCKKDCDQVTDKINRLFEQNNKQAEKLGKCLTEQEKLKKEIANFESRDLAKLEPAEKQRFAKIKQGVEKSPEVIMALIEATNKLDERVKIARTKHQILSQALGQLAGKVPTWAVVGQFLIKVGAAVGFLVAGNVNVPDPYKCADLAVKVTTDLGNVIGSLQGASDAASDMNEMIGKHAKK